MCVCLSESVCIYTCVCVCVCVCGCMTETEKKMTDIDGETGREKCVCVRESNPQWNLWGSLSPLVRARWLQD